MAPAELKLKIVILLTIGFGLASVLGYLAHRLKLSPILGYLLGGYLISPYSPGYTADLEMTEQLAEVGVILMMFGVGLHFKWQDLVSVKNIAIPGAIGQTFVASAVGAMLIYSIGWSLEAGILFGIAIGVASTVVLVRVLADNNILHTPEGHVCIGWLIVEDLITVAVLLILPTLANVGEGGTGALSLQQIALAFGVILLKFIILAALMFTIGRKFVSYVLSKVVETKSHELFTLTILALTFVIATGSSFVFGTSIALGSFIAGMVMGRTVARKEVATTALPLTDAFVVIFFLTIGMLFNPFGVANHIPLVLGVLAIILLVKPLTAFCITAALRYPMKTALVAALALAQIGEFSFILAEEANRLNLLPDDGYDIIIACSLISIAINPLLFNLFKTQYSTKT